MALDILFRDNSLGGTAAFDISFYSGSIMAEGISLSGSDNTLRLSGSDSTLGLNGSSINVTMNQEEN